MPGMRPTAAQIRTRFQGVENSPLPTPEQQARVSRIRGAVLDLAEAIREADLHPRYEATALTELETAAMFAVKGVFQVPEGSS